MIFFVIITLIMEMNFNSAQTELHSKLEPAMLAKAIAQLTNDPLKIKEMQVLNSLFIPPTVLNRNAQTCAYDDYVMKSCIVVGRLSSLLQMDVTAAFVTEMRWLTWDFGGPR